MWCVGSGIIPCIILEYHILYKIYDKKRFVKVNLLFSGASV